MVARRWRIAGLGLVVLAIVIAALAVLVVPDEFPNQPISIRASKVTPQFADLLLLRVLARARRLPLDVGRVRLLRHNSNLCPATGWARHGLETHRPPLQ